MLSGEEKRAFDGSDLADSHAALRRKSSADPGKRLNDAAFIQTPDHLHDLLFDDSQKHGGWLRQMDKSVREDFFAKAAFVDEMTSEVRVLHIHTFYYGGLMQNRGVTFDKVFDLAAHMGISPHEFARGQGYFGQICYKSGDPWDEEIRGSQVRFAWYCTGMIC